MRENVRLSAVVPVYNGIRYIERCLDSILPLLAAEDELIVVDDASEDGSYETLRARYRDERRLVLIRRTENGGPAAARNTGIRIARGGFIAFCDADDEWLDGHLRGPLAVLTDSPETQAVFTGEVTEREQFTERTVKLAAYAETDRYHFRTMVCRREVFDAAGLLDESLRMREDTEWMVRARKAGVRFEFLEEKSYLRHIQADGLSAGADEEGRAGRMISALIKGIRSGAAIKEGIPAAGDPAGRSAFPVREYPVDLSILIPMYNAEKYIAEAVASCRSDRCSAELIVVDDGSADGSAGAALPLLEALKEKGIPAFLVTRRHKGQASSRNDALHLARGRYILYLDADDYFLPGAVDAMAGAATAADSEVLLVSALCRDFISPELTEEEAASLKINPEPYRRMLAGCMFCSRALFDRIGEYNEDMPTSETAEWVMRMRDASVPVRETGDIVLARRYHRTNLGRTSRKAQMESYLALLRGRVKAREGKDGSSS